MWVLEASGEILQGKRMWLKPGKQYLFGRVKKDGVRFAIDHKTVSRKHFIIDVSPVEDSEVSQVHSRTRVKIIDQNSKSGTRVNNEELKGNDYRARELKLAENSVRPGNLEQELVIRWIPCVLTFYLLKKDIKAGALNARQARAKELGIKALSDFLPDHTTHLVAAKRNTPKGLQALITGKHLVTDSFLDALEVAATPTSLSQDENPSQLELDFDSAWPSEFNFLPTPGREPTLQPEETYKPGPDRSHIFENYIFVFGDQTQYDLLLPVVTVGHGKALRLNVTYGQTTVDEACTFMQNAAGRKTFGDAGDNTTGGVILLRWNAPEQHSDWSNNLIAQVSLKLDQRAIDQSEFLDAILANSATQLRQTIALESFTDGLRAPPASAVQSFAPGRGAIQTQTQMNGRAPMSTSQNQISQPGTDDGVSPRATGSDQHLSQPRKARFIPPVAIKKFDDTFDPNLIVECDEDEDEPEALESSPVDDNAALPQRKRRRSESLVEDSEGMMDDLLPAAKAMKRQRREWEKDDARHNGVLPTTTTTATSKPPSKKKELDVRAAMKKQRERQQARDSRSNSEEEALPPHDPEDREPANLAVIEYMDLPVRKRPGRAGINPEDDSRWDVRWNGLKNFKKFKPQGTVRKSNHSTKVLVPLVPSRRVGGLIVERDVDIDVDTTRGTRSDDAHQSQAVQTRKRAAPADSTNSSRNTQKQQKTLPVQDAPESGDESAESDGSKFKFGKGRGRRGRAR